MISLENKVIVITVPDGGIGTEACKLFAEQGAKLVLGSNNKEGLNKLADVLKGYKSDYVTCEVDITKEEEVKEFINLAIDKYGTVDMLLNLAGLSVAGKVCETEESDYDLNFDVNMKGTFFACKYFIPVVDEEKGGLIVNFASMASKNANPNAPLYCSAKAAVAMFSKGLALQLKQKSIRVTTMNPGGTNTGFWGDRKVPREKLMLPKDVAETLMFVVTREPHIMVTDISFESYTLFKSK